jgi:O-antigen/teichoic acid export membrane protein
LTSRLRELTRNTSIYGVGDIAVSLVNFFLWSVYVEYFNVLDYGTINLLLSMEVVAKILFRFGLDGAFLRFLYERDDRRGRQELASTIVLFMLVVDGAALLALLAWSPALAGWVLGDRAHAAPLRLMLINTFLIGFTFIPFSVLQRERRAGVFSLFTLFRSVATTALRLVLVISWGLGISGLYLADLIVTVATLLMLSRWFVPLLRPMFSQETLRETLRFGLPRVPHAAAQQVLAVGDKFIMKLFVSLDNIGVYGVAVSFGLMQKLFLSAFQSAWAPFLFETARGEDAPRVFRAVTSYGVAILALLTAGLSAVGGDAVAAMTHGRLLAPDDPRWSEVQTVITWTAVGVFLQGFYLLTSIGLNITKRTAYYPVATTAAAATNVGLNFVLIPRYGIVGAAWANGAGYAVQAVLGYHFSQRFYPIAYDWPRITMLCGASVLACVSARLLPSLSLTPDVRSTMAHAPDVLIRGLAVIVVFVVLAVASGSIGLREMREVAGWRRGSRATPAPHLPPETVEQAGEIVSADLGGRR